MTDNNKPQRLILIDGHGLAYRMFFAPDIPDFRTQAGEPTKATLGFTRTIMSLMVGDNPPDYIAVSFDVGDTFRNEMFGEYKGTREKMPDELHLQVGRMHDVLAAFNVPILEMDGYEADDILGTIARIADEMGLETTIITGDKDLLQLVSEHTKVEMPGRRMGGGSKPEVYDIAAVQERFGVHPSQFVDYKALIGDKSDNIPGVPGIGDKTAAQLLQKYGSLDGIYEHLDEITAKKTRTALEEKWEQAYLSQKLSQIIRDAPVVFELEACRSHDYNREKVVKIFRELEFRRLLDVLPGGPEIAAATPTDGQQLTLFGSSSAAPEAEPKEPVEAPTRTICVQDEAALDAMIAKLESAPMIAFDTETTSTDQMSAKLVGISLAVEEGEAYYIPVGHIGTDEPQFSIERVIERLRPVMTNPDIPKVGHNIKYDAVVLDRYGLKVDPLSFDTMIGEWLVRPDGSRSKLGLKAQAFIRLGFEMTEITQLIGTGKNQITMDRVSIAQSAPYAAADADMTLRLVEPIRADLVTTGADKLFYDIEMPLVPVLVAMEEAGALVDIEQLRRMSEELVVMLNDLRNQIYKICGYEFNLNSPKQLGKALFEDLKLPSGRKTGGTGNYSTAADVLEELRDQDTTGVISCIMEYREYEKLRSTYLDALPMMVNKETGRIHSSFNQTGAITGRISSNDPNLQNIPIRTDIGRRVRDAFIAPPGHKLVAADYSQVELRILAHVSGDERLREAFREGQDIHATTAATVYGIPLNAVTRQQRSFAKSVNFGLLYGMGAFRLARDSNLSLQEAEQFIKTYFERFPKIRGYLDGTLNMAKDQGYVETLLGRRRYFPIFQSGSGNRQDIARAEREAINMPVQGTAADIIKIAMVQLYRAMQERGLGSRLILQVHDELVAEVPDSEVEEMSALMREIMENAYPMDVPLGVDVNVGEHWGEMK